MSFPPLSELDPSVDRRIELLPKVELHAHLEGTMVPGTFLYLAQKNHHPDFMDLSPEQVMAMYEYEPGPKGFTQFLDLFGYCSEVIQEPEDIIYIIEQFGEYALGQNIRYVESTFTPTTIANQNGIPYRHQLPALLEGIQKVRETTRQAGRPLEIRFILDHSRGYDRADCIATAEACLEGFEQGSVVAMGLGGGESEDNLVSKWAGLIHEVTEGRIPFAPHVAEAVGPEAVFDARDSHYPPGFSRFGHGIQAGYSSEALAWLASEEILLELCPSSNVTLSMVPNANIMVRLLKTIQEASVPYTVSTDDPALLPNILLPGQANTLSNEFKFMVRLGVETLESLGQMGLLAIKKSFLPEHEKQALMADFSSALIEQESTE